jgi:hypothetical protein
VKTLLGARRGRRAARPYPWSRQAIHQISGFRGDPARSLGPLYGDKRRPARLKSSRDSLPSSLFFTDTNLTMTTVPTDWSEEWRVAPLRPLWLEVRFESIVSKCPSRTLSFSTTKMQMQAPFPGTPEYVCHPRSVTCLGPTPRQPHSNPIPPRESRRTAMTAVTAHFLPQPPHDLATSLLIKNVPPISKETSWYHP